MKEAGLKLGGALLMIMFVYLFLINFKGLEPFSYSVFPIHDSLVSKEDDIALRVSKTLWNYRSFDILIFAFLLFAATLCCASILNSKKVSGDDKN